MNTEFAIFITLLIIMILLYNFGDYVHNSIRSELITNDSDNPIMDFRPVVIKREHINYYWINNIVSQTLNLDNSIIPDNIAKSLDNSLTSVINSLYQNPLQYIVGEVVSANKIAGANVYVDQPGSNANSNKAAQQSNKGAIDISGSLYSYVGTPGTNYSSTPVSSYTGTPGIYYSSTPVSSYTGTPGTNYSSTPVSSYTGTPGTYYSSTPVSSYTGTPDTNYSSTSASSYTGTPDTNYSSTSASSYTGTPDTNYSSTSASSYTGTPDTNYSSTPVSSYTGAPSSKFSTSYGGKF